jgi:hypothetical protein
VTLHPATLLLAWGCLVVLLQTLSVTALAWAALLLLPLALLQARHRTLMMLRRARWLLLSIAVLFTLATPGERLPGATGDLGVTYDGLLMAAEHVLRLTLLLSSLAMLHQHLGNDGLIAGLHWLLAPLAGSRELRERIVVRLMLVLDYVETEPRGGWRGWLSGETSGPERLSLVTGRIGYLDWIVLALLTAAALWWWK